MFLLSIDTATEYASICISKEDKIIGIAESAEQKNHASFVQPAIADLLHQQQLSLAMIDAIAVTIGPGSYTGLRVGLASAKGICYALNKPLIAINTLEVMAQAALEHSNANAIPVSSNTLFCPLIDARRMEVFTAVYNDSLQEMRAAHALIIEEDSFRTLYEQQPVVFSGSGAEKLKTVLASPNIVYANVQHNASHLARRALLAYQSARFADLAYTEPLYVKEFFDTSKPKG